MVLRKKRGCRPLAGSDRSAKDLWPRVPAVRSAIESRGASLPHVQRLERSRNRMTGIVDDCSRSGRRAAGCVRPLVVRRLPAGRRHPRFSGGAGWTRRRWIRAGHIIHLIAIGKSLPAQETRASRRGTEGSCVRNRRPAPFVRPASWFIGEIVDRGRRVAIFSRRRAPKRPVGGRPWAGRRESPARRGTPAAAAPCAARTSPPPRP
jgi:hypothetical protein